MAKKQKKKVTKSTTPAAEPAPDAEVRTEGKEAVPTAPYPTVGDNPAFREVVERELAEGAPGPEDQAESPKRPPGRPPGTGKHQKAARALNEFQASGMDETVMSSVFKGLFQAGAFALDEPSIKLSDTEAVAFARPACVLWGYYMPAAISPVQAAWSQLGMAGVGVFGARSAAISRGLAKRRKLRTVKAGEAGTPGQSPAPPPQIPDRESPDADKGWTLTPAEGPIVQSPKAKPKAKGKSKGRKR